MAAESEVNSRSKNYPVVLFSIQKTNRGFNITAAVDNKAFFHKLFSPQKSKGSTGKKLLYPITQRN